MFYPEPDAGRYVEAAIRDGTQVFKAHVQVGRYEPNDAQGFGASTTPRCR
jgi:uncharacterized protein